MKKTFLESIVARFLYHIPNFFIPQIKKLMVEPNDIYVEGLDAFCELYSYFLFCNETVIDSCSMSLLTTLSFKRVPMHVKDDLGDSVYLVSIIWRHINNNPCYKTFIRHEYLPIRDYKNVICYIVLFSKIYTHLLVILDAETIYDNQEPLTLLQLEQLISQFKEYAISAYFEQQTYRYLQDSCDEISKLTNFVLDAMCALLRSLYRRCALRPFCSINNWLGLSDESYLVGCIYRGDSRALRIFQDIPFVLSFRSRLRLFQALIKCDKNKYVSSNEGKSVLKLYIRRRHMIEDSINQLEANSARLRQRVSVTFFNYTGAMESGVDAGGLFKELLVDLSSLLFSPNYGLFIPTSADRLLYPNSSSIIHSKTEQINLFELLGRIIGKAIYEGINIEPRFAPFFLSKILSNSTSLEDLPSLDSELYKNLIFLKKYEGNFNELGLDFTIVDEVLGEKKHVELLHKGSNINVDKSNVLRYIYLVADYYLNTRILDQTTAFIRGLKEIIDIRWLRLFTESELQILISGDHKIFDINDLKTNVTYNGFSPYDLQIIKFWEIIEEITNEERSRLLFFLTSCHRPPSLGFSALEPKICIQKVVIKNDDERLPTASTCFNTLKLPTYSTKDIMKKKLLYVISSNSGFELA